MLTLWHSSRYLLCYLMLNLIRCAIHLSYTNPIVFCPLPPLCCTRMMLLSARTHNANGAWIFYSDNWDQKPLRLGISPTLNFITYKDERKQHFSWYIILSVHRVYGPQQNTTQRGGGVNGKLIFLPLYFSSGADSPQRQTVDEVSYQVFAFVSPSKSSGDPWRVSGGGETRTAGVPGHMANKRFSSCVFSRLIDNKVFLLKQQTSLEVSVAVP